MSIKVICAACDGQFMAPDSAAGKFGKCPKCGWPVEVPRASQPSQPRPPQASPPRTSQPKPPRDSRPSPPKPDVRKPGPKSMGSAPLPPASTPSASISSGSPLDDLFSEEELSTPAARAPAAPKPPVQKQPSGLTGFKPKRKFTMAQSDWFVVACAAIQLLVLCVAFSGALDRETLLFVMVAELLIGLFVGLVGLIKGYRVYYKDDSVFQIGHGVAFVISLIFGLLPLLLLVSYYLIIRPGRTADARAFVLLGYLFFFGSWPGLALLGSAQRAENQQAVEVAATSAEEVDFRELRRDAKHRFIGVFNQQGDSLGRLVYSVPPGEHEPKSLSCVLMAPAGSNLMTGKRWATGDDLEALKYVDAGMAVLVYELPGEVDMEGLAAGRVSDAQYVQETRKFWASGGGVRNAQYAMRWLKENAAEIDPARLYAAGHSSAGTVALLVAARDARVKKVAVYAAPYELASWIEQPVLTALKTILPELPEQLAQTSPKTHAKGIQADVFIFHAKGDQNVAYGDSVAAAAHLRGLGKSVTMSSVDGGNHCDSVINHGIPRAIKWFNGQDVSSPSPPPDPSPTDLAASAKEDRQARHEDRLARHADRPTRPEDPAPGIAATESPMELPQPTRPEFTRARGMAPKFVTDGGYDFDDALLCLVAADGRDISEAMCWDPDKLCPVVGQRWGFGFHLAKSARKVEFTPETLMRSGAISLIQLSRSMTKRLTDGPNGHWPKPFGMVPPLVFLPSQSATKTLADARSKGLDYLLFFEMADRSRGPMARYEVARIELYDTAERKPLWTSPKQATSGRRGHMPFGGGPVMDKLAAAIDSKCSLDPMPSLEAEHVQMRIDEALALPRTTKGRTLELVAEVRYYQACELLEDDDAKRAYKALLDPPAASAMAGNDEADRRRELRRWMGD